MTTSCTSPVHLPARHLGKLSELSTVYQHVWDISRKISEMEDDPLPIQLDQSVPGFLDQLEKHATWLNNRGWPFLVLADDHSQINTFLHQYLYCDPLKDIPESVYLNHYIYIGYHHRQFAKVVHNDPNAEPFIVQNWEGLGSYLNSLTPSGSMTPSDPVQSPFDKLLSFPEETAEVKRSENNGCHHVEIFLPIEALKGGLQFIIPPHRKPSDLAKHLTPSHGLLYIVKGASLGKLELLLSRLLKEFCVNHQLLTLAPCLIYADKCPKDVNREEVLQHLHQYLPNLHDSSLVMSLMSSHLTEDMSALQIIAQDESPISEPNINGQNVNTDGASQSVKMPNGDIENDQTSPNSLLSEADQESVVNLEFVLHDSKDSTDDIKFRDGESLSNSDMSKAIHSLISVGLIHILEESIASKCQTLYSWLYSFVGRVVHHLRAFLNQAEKSHEERLATYSAITLQLQHLTTQTDDFFSSLVREVDGKVAEALTLLRAYLTRDDVLSRLSYWNDDDAPPDDEEEETWSDIDDEIRQKIADRIKKELLTWEKANQFFKNLRPCLIVHFEQRFMPIEHELNMVETRIARHNSQIKLSDLQRVEDGVIDREHVDRISCLPGSLNLKWQQKVLLSFAAPILLPLAVTIAFLGLPIIGGLMAKDLIVEKLAESKLREYNADRVKYLRRRTVNEVTKFCRSQALELFVQTELQPAYQCIEQLQKIVPGQIEANKAQIESLKNDFRDAKDVARFYQPLVEVFEHYKLLLMLYKVLHMKRTGIDIDANKLEIPDNVRWTSVGLKGSIKSGFLIDGANKKMVSIKYYKMRLDIRNIDDYLQEESAYRFQASNYIAKFLGICKLPRGEFTHILEPLKCSLRDYARENEVLGQKGEVSAVKYERMKQVMIEVVRGLDYLHERGWVHFDLNMDSVCVDFNDRIKLINISSRRMFRLPSQLSHSDIYKYTHLPHEVLMDPPSAYTHLSEMYCVGIMMWELWTGERAYYYEIGDPVNPLDTMEKFVAFIEQRRPKIDMFYKDVSKHNRSADEKAGKSSDSNPGSVEDPDQNKNDPDNDKKSPNSSKAESFMTSHGINIKIVGRDGFRRGESISKYAEMWVARLAQCWSEADRISSRAWLQLMDDVRQQPLPIQEAHFESP